MHAAMQIGRERVLLMLKLLLLLLGLLLLLRLLMLQLLRLLIGLTTLALLRLPFGLALEESPLEGTRLDALLLTDSVEGLVEARNALCLAATIALYPPPDDDKSVEIIGDENEKVQSIEGKNRVNQLNATCARLGFFHTPVRV